MFIMRRVGGGPTQALSFGRSKHKIYDRKELKTTFADVAGVDEATAELVEIVDFLKNPRKYQRLGGRIPKGVLLVGPPGTGKTLLARAVAGEARNLHPVRLGVRGCSWGGGLAVRTSSRPDKAPCIVFIDELTPSASPGPAPHCGATTSGSRPEPAPGGDGRLRLKGRHHHGHTNRPEVLDQALLRPGRFDRQVVVDKPDLRGREAILRIHARGVTLAPSVDLGVIAQRTPGFAGADLANIVNEAALLAARKERNAVEMSDFEEHRPQPG
jgi:cell division protease FtsH